MRHLVSRCWILFSIVVLSANCCCSFLLTGTLPNSVPSDYDADRKLRTVGRLDLKDYNDLLSAVVFQVCKSWCLRATNETVTITASHIEFGQTNDDPAIRWVDLTKGLHGDKKHKLSLTKISVRPVMPGTNMIAEDKNGPFCLYNLLKLYCAHLGEGYQGPLFHRRASEVKIKRRRAQGDYREAGLSSKYFFGKNYCNIVIRKLAKRCGFNEPNLWTVQSC